MAVKPRIEKSLSVVHNVKSVERATARKPGRITFELIYPHYLKSEQDKATDLIDKLLSQIGTFSEIRIIDLRLEWKEEEE